MEKISIVISDDVQNTSVEFETVEEACAYFANILAQRVKKVTFVNQERPAF